MARVVGVTGTSGGRGASTLAAVLASRAARSGLSVCLIDLDPLGGLEITMGLETDDGLGWSDMGGVEGLVDGEALLDRLPRAGLVPLLGWRGPSRTEVEAGPRDLVVHGLREACELLVVDLPRALPALAWAAAAADHVVLISGGDLRSLATMASLLGGPLAPRAPERDQNPRPIESCRSVVVRGDRGVADVPAIVESELGIAARLLADDRQVRRDLQQGRAPGRSGRAPSGRVADWLLERMADQW